MLPGSLPRDRLKAISTIPGNLSMQGAPGNKAFPLNPTMRRFKTPLLLADELSGQAQNGEKRAAVGLTCSGVKTPVLPAVGTAE